MNYSPASTPISATSRGALTDNTGQGNSDVSKGERNNVVTSNWSYGSDENSRTTIIFPKINSQATFVSEGLPLLTKPQLLRKKDSEIKRYKELIRKSTADCRNAIAGELYGLARQQQLRRKIEELKTENKKDIQAERLRNNEKCSNETERLRHQRDEARMLLETKDNLIRRLKMRIRHLEQVGRQRKKEIEEMKQQVKPSSSCG